MKRALLLGALLLVGCARSAPAPSADLVQAPFPDLGGVTVMLLPVQTATPTIGLPATRDTTAPLVTLRGDALRSLDAELAYWLPEAAPRIRWLLPEAIERAVQRSPMLDVRVRELPVQDFQRARLQSIGEPLYGQLRRVSLLMDARSTLLPIGAVWVREQSGQGRIHIAFALIDAMGGAVVWYGVVAGPPAATPDRAAIAATAQSFARMLVK